MNIATYQVLLTQLSVWCVCTGSFKGIWHILNSGSRWLFIKTSTSFCPLITQYLARGSAKEEKGSLWWKSKSYCQLRSPVCWPLHHIVWPPGTFLSSMFNENVYIMFVVLKSSVFEFLYALEVFCRLPYVFPEAYLNLRSYFAHLPIWVVKSS